MLKKIYINSRNIIETYDSLHQILWKLVILVISNLLMFLIQFFWNLEHGVVRYLPRWLLQFRLGWKWNLRIRLLLSCGLGRGVGYSQRYSYVLYTYSQIWDIVSCWALQGDTIWFKPKISEKRPLYCCRVGNEKKTWLHKRSLISSTSAVLVVI